MNVVAAEQLAIPLGDEPTALKAAAAPALTSGASSLTDEQEQAAQRRQGSLLLAAGAGSGKTSVLVERFLRAVLNDGLAPGRILAITFTERAAGELGERIRARLAQLGRREAARETEAAFIGTFHGFCARLLRAHPALAGLDPELRILDEAQAGRLRADAFAGALGAFIEREGTAGVDLVAAFGADRLRASIVGVYAQLRSQGQLEPALPLTLKRPLPLPFTVDGGQTADAQSSADTDALQSADGGAAAHAAAARSVHAQGIAACVLLDGLLRDFARRYRELKLRRGAADFDDLELLALALLRAHADVRAAWSQRFELLMVDEFQDTNPRQLALLEALQRENLFTVGDELQSIYGFRHADAGIFRARRQQLAERGAALALTHNFRSRPPLLAAINAVFATRFGASYTPLRAGRDEQHQAVGAPIELLLSDRRAWNGGGEGLPDVGGELPAAPRWRHAEARLLAQRVAEIVHSGEARAGDVAVLLRALGDLPVYQRALEERGLRTLATVGGFWGQQQVGDLLAYLRLLANPLDEVALYSTLASPLVGISTDGLVHIARVADGKAAWEVACRLETELRERLCRQDARRLQRFTEYLSAERTGAHGRPIAELLLRAIDACAYDAQLLALRWGERRLANVHKLLRLSRRFEAQEGRDLRGFLDHIAHQLDARVAVDAGAEPEAPLDEQGGDAVRLLSIHAAKGLEFPVVCLADLGRAPRVLTPDLLIDGDRLGLRVAQLDGSAPLPTLHYQELLAERRLAEAAEEERILYVAVTRARERLLLSGAVDFERWPRAQPGAAPIAWLGPALASELPALAREAAICAVHEDLLVQGTNGVRLQGTNGVRIQGTNGVRMRCLLNTPASFGTVLREESLHAVESPSPSSASGLPLSAALTSPPSSASGSSSPPALTSPPISTSGLPPASALTSSPTPAPGSPAPSHSTNTPAKGARPLPLPPNQGEYGLSYTSLSELERCGYRHYLERVLHLPEDRGALRGGQGLEGRRRGIFIHRIMQQLDFTQPPPSQAQLGRLARELGTPLRARERSELAELLRLALSSDLARRLAAAPHALREHPFAFALTPQEPLLTGTLDLLLREPPGDWLVLDYKSDRLHEDEDLEALVVREYGAQRLIYALAALEDGAPRVQVVHWFLERPHQPATARFAAAQLPRLRRELQERAARARSRGYAVSATPHRRLCLTCPGRATLCSWGSAETLRPEPSASPLPAHPEPSAPLPAQ
jgi:ATP-dependent helicase/nuclease subunit A